MKGIVSIVVLILVFWSCGDTNKNVNIDEKAIQQQVIWHLQEDTLLSNYSPLSFEPIDTQFLTIDETWEILFYYQNAVNNDTVCWTYDQLVLNSQKTNFARDYQFVRKEQLLRNSLYYGLGYILHHTYMDSVIKDTFKIKLSVDTNLNIKQKEYY